MHMHSCIFEPTEIYFMYWYEEEVKRVEHERKNIGYNPKTIFYGSSSIRLWESLYQDFAKYNPVNLGFGGSTLEACVYFFERIMEPYNPGYFVIYAGDNDLGDGRKPDEVHNYFIQLCKCITECFGRVPMSYISIKPSLQRWQINDAIHYTNLLIQQTISRHSGHMYFVDVYSSMIGEDGFPEKKFYAEDGLHLSKEGYTLWKKILLTHISLNNDSSLMLT